MKCVTVSFVFVTKRVMRNRARRNAFIARVRINGVTARARRALGLGRGERAAQAAARTGAGGSGKAASFVLKKFPRAIMDKGER